MTTITIKAYKGADVDDQSPTYMAVLHGPGGKPLYCCAHDVAPKTDELYGSPEWFKLMLQMGAVHTGGLTELAHKFLAQPENVLLWETTTEGELNKPHAV